MIIYKLISLFKRLDKVGLVARVLLVLVKPLCLLFSIKYDSDAGVNLAQIFLISMFFVSFSGTNAHKKFYELKFSKDAVPKLEVTKSYIEYLEKIALQLLLISIAAIFILSIIFYDLLMLVFLGIVFGTAEKITDEYQRYAQFCNDSFNLFFLASIRLISGFLATIFSFYQIVDVWIVFPILIFLGILIVNFRSLAICFSRITDLAGRSIVGMLKTAFFHIKADMSQISWVFTSMSLISIDKWLIQYFSVELLPRYILFTQIASIAIVAQTIFLIAPIRVRLINENPSSIKSLQVLTISMALLLMLVGLLIFWFYKSSIVSGSVEYFAFFIASTAILSAAQSERLYWVISDNTRMLMDVVIIVILIVGFIFINYYVDIIYKIHGCLSLLVTILFFRFILMLHVLRTHNKGVLHASNVS